MSDRDLSDEALFAEPDDQPTYRGERIPREDRPPGSCENGCHGGWRYVTAAYADRLVRFEDGVRDERQYASLLRTVYPCPACRRDAFFRWKAGHMDSGHDEVPCDDEACRSRGSRRKRTTAA